MAERGARPGRAEAAVFALTVLAFVPALSFPFLRWDDAQNVAANDWLRFDRLGVFWMLTGSKLGHWQPLTFLSYALDRALWGPGPFGFHLTNVLLHGLNAALLCALARRLKLGGKAGPVLPAVVAALFWSLHPLRVESVAWVTERRDVLCAALSLLCALFTVRAAEEPAKARAWRLAALACGAAAMSAKVFAVVLPAALLVLERRVEGKPRLEEKLVYFPFVAVALFMNLGAQAESGAAIPLARFGLSSRVAQAALNLAFYPFKTVLPTGLSPLYELSPVLEPRPFAVAACAVLAAGVLLFVFRRKKGLLEAAAAYLILLLPVLGFFKSGRMVLADRWSYLPAIPLSMLLAAGLARALTGLPLRAASAAVLLFLAGLTYRHLPVYSSDLSLWEKGVEGSPLSWFALDRLADAQEKAGDANAESTRRRSASLRRFVLGQAADAAEARGDRNAADDLRRRAEEPQ